MATLTLAQLCSKRIAQEFDGTPARGQMFTSEAFYTIIIVLLRIFLALPRLWKSLFQYVVRCPATIDRQAFSIENTAEAA